jgi:polar amino acid transport system substrate-binding protein
MEVSMNLARRFWLTGLLAGALLVAGCATTPPPAASPQARAALAPTGKLRVGVYPGSPTSMVVDKSGSKAGVAYELGREFARWLDVPFEPVEYRRIAEVIEAMKTGEVDFTFTNATEARARDIDFTLPMLDIELGYLVPAGSKLSSAADIDQPGVRVGVTEGSTSLGTLTRLYRHATVVPVPSLKAAAAQLAHGKLDAFATNKGILFELADGLPGARVLDGRWGQEHMAIGIPRGRGAGLSYLSSFALAVRRDGTLQGAVSHAGLRGTVEPSNR